MTKTRQLADIHPDDLEARTAIRDQLAAIRQVRRPNIRTFATSIGLAGGTVQRWEEIDNPNPYWHTVQRVAGGLGRRFVATPVGLPGLIPATPVPAGLNDDQRDDYDRRLTVVQLRTVRLRGGITEADLREFGDVDSIRRLEGGNDHRRLPVSSIQRYARALAQVIGVDGWLDLRLEVQ